MFVIHGTLKLFSTNYFACFSYYLAPNTARKSHTTAFIIVSLLALQQTLPSLVMR